MLDTKECLDNDRILSNGISIPILDGAAPSAEIITPEWEAEKIIASDPHRDLEERLEAYENIIDSEIGDTNMIRARNIEREVGFRQLFLKFDGGNPTGTQKDRIAFAQAMDAMRRGFHAITTATCGNYGVALALAASFAGIKCFIHVPGDYHTKRFQEMMNFGAEIIQVPGDYEHAVKVSSEYAEKNDIYDANPGGANTTLQLKAYGEIAHEIYDDLRDSPAIIAVPVSNGTTLAGIYKGFLNLDRRGKISHMPRFIAGSSYGKNPIVHSFIKNAANCENLPPGQIRETPVNEPLVNWHSIDGEHALQAIRSTGGWASYASDRLMQSYAKLVREKEGLNVLPASTAGLIALIEYHRKNPLPNDRYVAILTGRR